MKKISFGSFPLTEIRAEDRKCLDRYLIKTFADNISISDAIRNLAVTKNLMYITPDALMKAWLENKDSFTKNSRVQSNDRESNSIYNQALRRAFFILKEFYKKIKNAPFYKDFIFYPIYIEKIDKIDVGGNADRDEQYTEVQMNYSFLILSNDLTKSIKVDEVRYDENASLNFLFLFVEFFAGGTFGKSIHDFKQEDYEFLVKLYQFVEQSGKDPIHLTLDLYKLLGMVKEAVEGGGRVSSFKTPLQNLHTVEKFSQSTLKKYKGLIKHKIMDLIKQGERKNPGSFQEAFIQIMNAIFKAEDLSGLYDGLDSSAELQERYQYQYNTNKYREILNLAKELIEYNKLDCQDVISTDSTDFDFKVEQGDYSIETQSQILAQKYQTFFKTYVDSISNYLKGIIETIITDLKIDQTLKTDLSNNLQGFETSIKNNEAIIQSNTDNIIDNQKEINRLRGLIRGLNANRYNNIIRNHQADIALRERTIRDWEVQNQNLTTENEQRRVLVNLMSGLNHSVDSILRETGDKVYDEIKESVLSAIANDLAFIYDDGKRFFTNELVTKGFMQLAKDNNYELLRDNGDGFQKVVNDIGNKTIKPEEDKKPNPKYYAGEVVSALNDSFTMTAKDAIVAIRDAIRPAVAKALQVASKNLTDDYNTNTGNTFNPFRKNVSMEPDIVNNMLNQLLGKIDLSRNNSINTKIENQLRDNILRNRFISNVLKNFEKMFTVKKLNKVIQFDQDKSQLHPLIKKLVNKNDGGGKRCQYFKSFIINYDTCEQLYKIKFLTDTQKFLQGLERQPPRKLSNPMNRLQTVLFEFLGLKDNPVWVISKTNVYLSMPDDLSLTNSAILSKISKTELMDVCKIKETDYWNEKTMGTVAEFGNKKIARYHKEIEKEEKNIEEWKSQKYELKDSEKTKRKDLEKKIDQAQKKIRKIEDNISKLSSEEKTYKPNAFLFAGMGEDDPNKAENTELLSDTEKSELAKSKEDLKNRLLELNPFDDNEVAQMEKDIEKARQDHPMDLLDLGDEMEADQKSKNTDQDDMADFEKFLKMREDFHNKK
jgi:hypothetical protein